MIKQIISGVILSYFNVYLWHIYWMIIQIISGLIPVSFNLFFHDIYYIFKLKGTKG